MSPTCQIFTISMHATLMSPVQFFKMIAGTLSILTMLPLGPVGPGLLFFMPIFYCLRDLLRFPADLSTSRLNALIVRSSIWR